jgi:sugar phosphate isomerase/epimerase
MRTHVMPGEGELPLRELLATMAQDRYDGIVTLELHPREVGVVGRIQQARRMRQALDFVRAASSVESAQDVDWEAPA